jgi:hypothetical protein
VGEAACHPLLFFSADKRLAAVDPSSTELQRDVLQGPNRIGELLEKRGQVQEAIAAYQASHLIAEGLADVEPTNDEWRYLAYRQLGRVRELEGNKEEARDTYQAKKVVLTNSALRPGEPPGTEATGLARRAAGRRSGLWCFEMLIVESKSREHHTPARVPLQKFGRVA